MWYDYINHSGGSSGRGKAYVGEFSVGFPVWPALPAGRGCSRHDVETLISLPKEGLRLIQKQKNRLPVRQPMRSENKSRKVRSETYNRHFCCPQKCWQQAWGGSVGKARCPNRFSVGSQAARLTHGPAPASAQQCQAAVTQSRGNTRRSLPASQPPATVSIVLSARRTPAAQPQRQGIPRSQKGTPVQRGRA